MSDRAVHRVRPRALPLLLACLATLVALTGCSSLSGAGDKGFVSGDGQIRTLAPEERDAPVELSGRDLAGDPLDLADLRGSVVVVNVWGSWCAPCRKEMPDLVEATATLAESDVPVEFAGINIRDHDVAQARSFVRTFEVPFPSFHSPDGKALLPFSGDLPPNAIPSTVLLDREGRVAAAIIGPVPSAGTVVGLAEDLAAEGAEGDDG